MWFSEVHPMPELLSTRPAASLLAELKTCAKVAFAQTAEVLRLLAEVDRRDAWTDKPYGSLFAYCLGELLRSGARGRSSREAAKKIQACRAGRRYPLLLERLAAGRLHLCGLVLLAPRLTDENHRELIDAACGLSKRGLEQLLAARFPKPDVAPSLRKLPARRDAAGTTSHAAVSAAESRPTPGTAESGRPHPPTFALRASERRATVAPLAAARHQLTVTIGTETRERLERVQALLSHRGPEERTVESALDAALELLEAKLLKERFGVGAKPRKARPTSEPPPAPAPEAEPAAAGEPGADEVVAAPAPRTFSQADRRTIVARDGLQCSYVDPDTGVRCGETRWLSFDHIIPWARGGPSTADNGRLLCGPHNRAAARRVYGDAFVRSRMAQGARDGHA